MLPSEAICTLPKLKQNFLPAQQRVLPSGLGIVCDIVGPNGLQVQRPLITSFQLNPDTNAVHAHLPMPCDMVQHRSVSRELSTEALSYLAG